MNIILCGMPGSGKTYFGKIIASTLGLHFIDTDELLMQEYFKSHHQHATCREITLKEGEPFFRSLESKVIREMDAKKAIVAIGGGAFGSQENLKHLKKIGRLVYLKTAPETLLERLMKKNPLPSYLDKDNIGTSFTALLEKRVPLFEKHSQYTIDTSSEDVVEAIKNIIKEMNHGE
jgi:shikimate kinase